MVTVDFRRCSVESSADEVGVIPRGQGSDRLAGHPAAGAVGAQHKELFIAAAKDPRRLAAVAEGDTRQVYDRWLESIEKKHAVSWKREPRNASIPSCSRLILSI